MQLHHFNPVSRIYTHSTPAQPSPLEDGKFLTVAFASASQLPTIPAGSVARRTGDGAEGDGWQVLENHIGPIWDTTTKEKREHAELGPLPAGFTSTEPAPFDSWDGSEWFYDIAVEIADTLPNIETQINNACKAAIEAGFSSDALGTTHTYESELEDQLNLSGNIQRAKDVPHKCRNNLGEVDYRIHTTNQIHQVGEDLATHKMAQLQKAATLKAQANAAATAGDLTTLKAVTW